MCVYVVMVNGPFHKWPICFYYTEKEAEDYVKRMNIDSHYEYYWEEVEQGFN